MLYTVKKINGQWRVVDADGRIQFTSLTRSTCTQWIINNTPRHVREAQAREAMKAL